MHANKKGLGTSVLGAVLTTVLFAATSAGAATVSNVQVAEGNDYNNVTVSATVTDGDSDTVLVYKIYAVDGELATPEATVEGAAGATSQVLDLSTLLGDAKNKTYRYEVSVKGSDPASKADTVYSNVGAYGEYFSASASTDPGTYNNGAWAGDEPDIENSKFQIDGSTATFNVTSTTSLDPAGMHQMADFQCSASISSYYLLDDITNDVTGAIGAMALVTNETSDTAYWMVLKEGTNWVEVSTEKSLTLLGDYTLRAWLDYSSSPATVLYSIKKGSGDWVDLTWSEATNNAAVVSQINFLGKTEVANFGADLSTKALVNVDGTEYQGLNDALNAYTEGTSDPIVRYTKLTVNAGTIPQTTKTYQFDTDGKAITVIPLTFAAPATSGTSATLDASGDTLTVKNANFLAEVGTVDDVFETTGNARFFTVGEAIAALTDNKTLFLIADATASSAIDEDGVTLNLRGFTLTHPDSPSAPILTITGSDLVISNGTIGGTMTTIPAILADGGSVEIGENAVLTGNSIALNTANEGSAELAGGLVENCAVNGNVKILSGYLVGTPTFANTVKATGGKFTDDAKTAGSAVAADCYTFVAFAVPETKGSYSVTYEVVTNAGGTAATDSKVYTISDKNETVVVPDTFVGKVTSSTDPATQQSALKDEAKYSGGTLTKWQCYVLGMEKAADKETTGTTNEGPRPEAVQSSSADNVAFKLATPAAIKAIEAGCDVQYEVEEYDSPSGTKTRTSDKVNWDESVQMTNPGAVRYYKMKVYISTKQ